jgi:hypothetical protein
MFPLDATAKAFYSKQEALTAAFPDADKVDTQTFFLTETQAQHVTTLTGAPLESKLATMYVGQRAGQLLGYAVIETSIVRTLPETFLIVISPTGVVEKLFILAFYEPEEYMPSERWLKQFEQQKLHPDLQVRRDIHGIAGATLTSRAITSGVRRALALFHVLLQKDSN